MYVCTYACTHLTHRIPSHSTPLPSELSGTHPFTDQPPRQPYVYQTPGPGSGSGRPRCTSTLRYLPPYLDKHCDETSPAHSIHSIHTWVRHVSFAQVAVSGWDGLAWPGRRCPASCRIRSFQIKPWYDIGVLIWNQGRELVSHSVGMESAKCMRYGRNPGAHVWTCSRTEWKQGDKMRWDEMAHV